jgi:opacity protein-like surface antigen
VAKLSNLTRIAALALLVGTAAAAQDPWSLSFKMAGGPTMGDIATLSGTAGYNFGGDIEAAYQLDKKSQFAFGLGYRFFPGDYQNLSFIPSTIPASNPVAITYYETRVRKAEAMGFQLNALYRRDMGWEGSYWQAGLRIGFNKVKQTDTGTRLTTTGAGGSGSVTAVNAIADIQEKTVTSLGPLVGVGYRFNETYSLEVNFWSASMESPATGKKTGTATELAFGIRF